MKKLLFLLLAAVTSLPSFAGDVFEYTYEGNTLKYEVIDEDNATCKVINNIILSSNKFIGQYSGSIIIPDYAIHNDKKYHITEITDDAFKYCKRLTNITIPNSVTTIGKLAFCGCDSLTNITIPNSVTTIGDRAFSSCTSLTNITIPNSVKEIGESLFYGCNNLKTVRINRLIDATVRNELVKQIKEENQKTRTNPIQIVLI